MDRHGERSALANDKIRDRWGQWGPRNVRISPAKIKPHMARKRQRVIAGNLWEMGTNVIPGINKWSALTIWVVMCFFLVGMVRFRIHGLLAYVMRGRRSGDNLFSFMMRGALAFPQRHYAGIWLEKKDGGVWGRGRGSGEERENGKGVLGRKKEFVFGLQRDSLLNTQVINAGTKGSDRLAIRKGMKLMKWRLCFKTTAKLGNSKGQHCLWHTHTHTHIYIYMRIYIYIYMRIYICICKVGTTVQKTREGKENGKTERARKSFIHI